VALILNIKIVHMVPKFVLEASFLFIAALFQKPKVKRLNHISPIDVIIDTLKDIMNR